MLQQRTKIPLGKPKYEIFNEEKLEKIGYYPFGVYHCKIENKNNLPNIKKCLCFKRIICTLILI